MTTAFLINTIRVISLLMEGLYSSYKRDNAHSFSVTTSNTLRGIIGHILQNKFFILYLGWFYILFNPASTLDKSFNLLSFLSCLLTLDLAGYLLHKANHRFTFLWTFHSVHHSDRKVNLSTGFRVSWLEQTYSFVIFIPVLLLGFNLSTIIASAYTINLFSLFCHNHYINLPRFFDYIFITPENHRVHHDEHTKNQNSNYGNLFSIWDRMFGTFQESQEPLKFGIKGCEQNNFIKMETDPVIDYLKKLRGILN